MIDNKTYALIKKLMPILCVDLVVHFGNKYLLCKRNNEPVESEWWIPGGRVLKGETLAQAVHRKAKEELGIEVIVEKQAGIVDMIFEEVHTPTVVYLARPASGSFEITLDSQHSEYRWFDTTQTMKLHPLLRKELALSGV